MHRGQLGHLGLNIAPAPPPRRSLVSLTEVNPWHWTEAGAKRDSDYLDTFQTFCFSFMYFPLASLHFLLHATKKQDFSHSWPSQVCRRNPPPSLHLRVLRKSIKLQVTLSTLMTRKIHIILSTGRFLKSLLQVASIVWQVWDLFGQVLRKKPVIFKIQDISRLTNGYSQIRTCQWQDCRWIPGIFWSGFNRNKSITLRVSGCFHNPTWTLLISLTY